MPPKMTSTRSSWTSFSPFAAATASSVAPSSSTSSSVPPEQAAPGVDVADDHAGDVGVREPDERERARLVRDHSHLDGASPAPTWFRHALLPSVARRRWGDASCERMLSDRRPHTSGALPILDRTAPPRRVRRHAGARAGQRVRPAARVAAALVPARVVDLRGGRLRRARCARPPTGSRCCATSAAPATRTRSRRCSATRSRSAPRRSSTTPAIPTEVMGDVVEYATAGRSDEERDAIIKMLQETAHEWAVHNFRSGCEVADMLVERLDFGPERPRGAGVHVRALERQGLPDPRGRRGDPAARCASCT